MTISTLTTTPRPTSRARRNRRVSVAALALVALLGACTSDDTSGAGGKDGSPEPTDRRTPQAPPAASGAAALALTARPGPDGAQITVDVTPPRGATEMQVSLDPSFTGATWEPVAETVKRRADGGYQEVFARFRGADGTESAETAVAGVDVDLHREAATSRTPAPTAIGLEDPTALAVDIQVGRIVRGLETAGDVLDGPEVDAESLDSGWALKRGRQEVRIVRTERSTRPTDTGHRGDDGEDTLFPVAHRIRLELAEPVTVGDEYTLTSPLGSTTRFTIDDRSTRSPAVHANQVGYRPGDVSKVAYLSAPYGSDGVPAQPEFHVVPVGGGAPILDGTGVEAELGEGGEVNKGDLTGTRVWRLDFSGATTPGRYRVCVDRIGCSESFAIDEDSTWLRVATTVARGLYHQRSGIALGAPHTSVSRPRPDHPDDGLEVRESGLTALEAADLPDDKLFEQLVAKQTDTVVDGAWGGHFDAGDWDRRAQHLWMVRQMFDLLRVAPDRFSSLDLHLPESANSVPDLADEALWTLDLFRRMQRDDGAVRGGIESAHYPDWGTPSWKDVLPRYAYAPDAWSTYIYVSAAIDASIALRDVDATRSEDFADSARRAMAWAEDQEVPKKFADKIAAQRGVAAASMLELTGDPAWNDVFREATPFDDGPQYVLGCNANDVCDSGWNYLRVDPQVSDPQLVANVRQSFSDTAERVLKASESTKYGWCLEDPDVPLIWGLGVGGAPRAIVLLRAWLLTKDQRFRAAAERCASVSLGANPLDTSFVTGVGANPARHPLIVDVNVGQLPVWAGTPVYGPHTIGEGEQWVIQYRLEPAGATGDLYKVPYLQSWWDLGDVGPMDEFTVYQSHGPALWVYGVLSSASPVAPA